MFDVLDLDATYEDKKKGYGECGNRNVDVCEK